MVTSMTTALISVSVHHAGLFRVERDLGRPLVLSQTQNKKDLLYFTQLQDTVFQIESFYPCIQFPRNREVARRGGEGEVLGYPFPAPCPFVSIF